MESSQTPPDVPAPAPVMHTIRRKPVPPRIPPKAPDRPRPGDLLPYARIDITPPMPVTEERASSFESACAELETLLSTSTVQPSQASQQDLVALVPARLGVTLCLAPAQDSGEQPAKPANVNLAPLQPSQCPKSTVFACSRPRSGDCCKACDHRADLVTHWFTSSASSASSASSDEENALVAPPTPDLQLPLQRPPQEELGLSLPEQASSRLNRASVAASSVYSLPDEFALENARLREPFSPCVEAPESWWCEGSEVEEKGLRRNKKSTSFSTSPPDLTSSNTSSRTPSPHTTPLTPDTVIESFRHELTTAFFPHSTSSVLEIEQTNAHGAHAKMAAEARARTMARTGAITDYEADLSNTDRMKQRDAIRKILASKVRNDWDYNWSEEERPRTPAVGLEESRSKEDGVEWRERDEWESNISEDDIEVEFESIPNGNPSSPRIQNTALLGEGSSSDPYRFASPNKSPEERAARRRRRLHEEMKVNDGLRHFTHRRNAWTGARHVILHRDISRQNGKHTTPIGSPSKEDTPPSSSSSSHAKVESWLASSFNPETTNFVTQIPIPSPILPPETPLRKNVTEKSYSLIYDKVILQSQTPYAPLNLGVVVKCCVEGWRRDGEWPPRGTAPEASIASVKRDGAGKGEAMRAAMQGGKEGGKKEGMGEQKKEKGKDRSLVRRSIQKVMGVVRERRESRGSKDGEGAGAGVVV